MDKIFDLVSKLMLDKDKVFLLDQISSYSEEKLKFYNWIKIFYEDDFRLLFESIYKYTDFIFDSFINNALYNSNLNLTYLDFRTLYTIYIIKAVQKTFYNPQYSLFHYINSNDVLDDIVSCQKKFWIYYIGKSFTECIDFRKCIFKFCVILIEGGIIKQKIHKIDLKTPISWSFGLKSINEDLLGSIKYSFNPWKLVNIDDEYFLKSCFFLDTSLVFKKNSYSKKKILFSSQLYLEKLTKICLEVDFDSFFYVKKQIEKSFDVSLDNIYMEVDKMIDSIIEVDLEIEEIKILGSRFYLLELNTELGISSEMTKFEKFWKILRIKYDQSGHHFNLAWDDFVEKIKKTNIDFWEKKSFEDLIADESNFNSFLDFDQLTDKKLFRIIKNLNLAKSANSAYYTSMNEISEKKRLRKQLQSRCSKLMSLVYMNIIESFKDKKLYFPYFFDFRGRFYVNSQIGITNFKFSRYFYHYGYYDDKEIKKASLEKCESRYLLYVSQVKNHFLISGYEKTIFWIILSVGKEFILKNKSKIPIEDILNEGVNFLLEENSCLDFEKNIILFYYKKILKSIANKKFLKYFIHKDATASFIQNSIRVFGPKNLNSYTLSNMEDSGNWYDPYMLAIEKWQDSLVISDETVFLYLKNERYRFSKKKLEYFNRKTTKYVLMTGPYAAKYITMENYFSEALRKEFNIDLNEDDELKTLFKHFYFFIENSFWTNYFLAQSPKVLVEYVEKMIKNENSVIIKSHDSETDLIYYKFKNKSWDLIIKIPFSDKKVRKTKVVKTIDCDKIDIRKLKDSIRANCVHFSEALSIRDINNHFQMPLLTIHDCFLVDMFNVDKFINVANQEMHRNIFDFLKMQNQFKKKTRSIFIFI